MNEFFVNLGFNTELNNEIAKQVSEGLSNKYGKSFSVDFLGDRLNTEYAKLYAHPESRPDEMFCVYLYRDTDVLEDDYTLRINLKKISDAIEKAYADEGTDAGAKVSPAFFDGFHTVYEEEEPRAFAEKYVKDEFFVYLAVKSENSSADVTRRALSSARKAVGADIRAVGYTYNGEKYDEALNTIRKALDSGRTPLEDCEPFESFTAFASEDGCAVTAEHIRTNVGRS